jgi:hypothetical protein
MIWNNPGIDESASTSRNLPNKTGNITTSKEEKK